MWPCQPVRDPFIIERMTKVRHDQSEGLPDALGVELEGKVDFFKPRSTDPEEIGALKNFLGVDIRSSCSLVTSEEMADQHWT